MTLIINPGSGPVSGATRENAASNLYRFVDDLKEGGHAKVVQCLTKLATAPESEGRFTFVIDADGERHEIEMPGLPLDQVRWMDQPDQNIWDFPRLYVDGSSWVWFYALRSTMDEPEEESS